MTLVAPGLLVGSLDECFDRKILTTYRVTHILNVASELNFNERVSMVYEKFGVDDDSHDTNIQCILEKAIRYISSAIHSKGVVFVHCLEGKSRSVCVVLAYMVTILGADWEPCLNTIKHNRIVDVFPQYLLQTIDYCMATKS